MRSCSTKSQTVSVFNNMALAKILHHFNNTRVTEELLEESDKALSSSSFTYHARMVEQELNVYLLYTERNESLFS